MKTIPTYVHGILDYVIGIALLLAPNLFGFAHLGGAAVNVPRIIGLLILIQALFTNYEFGLFKIVPMRMHLAVDYAFTVLLAVSPWMFGFNNQPANVWMPHVVVGVLGFVLALLTQTVPHRVPTVREHRTVI